MSGFKWTAVENGFIYSANDDSTQSASFTISGSSVTDSDSDGVPDNVSVEVTGSGDNVGLSATVSGFDNISINAGNKAKFAFEGSGSGVVNYNAVTNNDSTKSGSFVIETDGTERFKIDRVVALTEEESDYDGMLIALSNANGQITINGDAIGISGDDNYNATYVGGYFMQVRGISDGASLTPNESLLNECITDENLTIYVGSGTFRYINESTLHQVLPVEIASNESLSLTAVDGKLASIAGLTDGYNLSVTDLKEEYPDLPSELGSVTFQTDGGSGIISYNATAINDSTKSGSFVIESNGNEQINVKSVRWLSNGAMITIDSLSGSISINGNDIGILGDDNYEVHYIEDYLRQVRGISDGASLSNHDSLLNEYMMDDNLTMYVGSGTFRYINESTLFQVLPVEITSNESLNLTAVDGKLASITGLTDGYSLSVANVTEGYTNMISKLDSVAFKTDGSQGTLQFGSSVYTISGDNEFAVEFDDSGQISGLVDFYGMLAGNDTIAIDGENFTLDSALKQVGLNYFSAEKSGLNIEGNILRDGPTYLFLTSDSAQTATVGSENADATISIESTSASLLAANDENFDLTFSAGTEISNWFATLSSGDDSINIDNISGGIFNGGAGEDIFRVSSLLSGNVTITGGSTDANTYYSQGTTVSSASEQNKITITDVNFNIEDVLSVDAGISNLTADFFGDGKFYNFGTAEQASTSGVYAKNVFDASQLVSNLKMNFSMVRMIDNTNTFANVVWTNSTSSTINFSNQDDDVLIFTNTNNRGDVVSLNGDFDDTIHVGKNDTVNPGSGDDVIIGWNSSNVLILDEVPNDIFMAGSDLVFESNSSNTTISAVNSTVKAVIDGNEYLIGNSDDNKLTAGNTSSTLWGNGGNDVLIGGTGNDVFRFTANDDNVTIKNADSNDILDLSDWSFDELKNYRFNNNGIVLSMGANQSLNIVGTNMTDLQFTDSTHVINFENKTIS